MSRREKTTNIDRHERKIIHLHASLAPVVVALVSDMLALVAVTVTCMLPLHMPRESEGPVALRLSNRIATEQHPVLFFHHRCIPHDNLAISYALQSPGPLALLHHYWSGMKPSFLLNGSQGAMKRK